MREVIDFIYYKKAELTAALAATHSLAMAFGWWEWSNDQEAAVFGFVAVLFALIAGVGHRRAE